MTAEQLLPVEQADEPVSLGDVEAKASDLMRRAAQRDGMKIGEWVAARMKEAATRSLASTPTALPGAEDVALREAVDQGCRIPPVGWWCSRERGHEGPCAARQETRPTGAGWSKPPTEEAGHDERLTADELAALGLGVSEWAYNHLAKGYAVSLTVREVKRLIAALQSPRASGEPKVGQHITLKTGETGVINRVAYHVQFDEPDGSQGPMGGSVGMYECEDDEISPRASDEVLGEASDLDRPFLLAAARAWWAAKMPASFVRNVTVKGNGRIDVAWADSEESGKYTLPVTFLQEVAALSASPVPVDASGTVRKVLDAFAMDAAEVPEVSAATFIANRSDTIAKAILAALHTAPVADAQAGEGE